MVFSVAKRVVRQKVLYVFGKLVVGPHVSEIAARVRARVATLLQQSCNRATVCLTNVHSIAQLLAFTVTDSQQTWHLEPRGSHHFTVRPAIGHPTT